jgi:hypothetical protein
VVQYDEFRMPKESLYPNEDFENQNEGVGNDYGNEDMGI